MALGRKKYGKDDNRDQIVKYWGATNGKRCESSVCPATVMILR